MILNNCIQNTHLKIITYFEENPEFFLNFVFLSKKFSAIVRDKILHNLILEQEQTGPTQEQRGQKQEQRGQKQD